MLEATLVSEKYNLKGFLYEEDSNAEIVSKIVVSRTDTFNEDELATFVRNIEQYHTDNIEKVKKVVKRHDVINKIYKEKLKTELFEVANGKKTVYCAGDNIRVNESLPLFIKIEKLDENLQSIAKYFNTEQLHFAIHFSEDKQTIKPCSTGSYALDLSKIFTNPTSNRPPKLEKSLIDYVLDGDSNNEQEVKNNIDESINAILGRIGDLKYFEEQYIKELHTAKIAKISDILKVNKNIILHGAPGTGKTWMARNDIAEKLGITDEKRKCFIQFHPSFDYTDFIEGIKPVSDGKFVRVDGIFKQFCKAASKDTNNNYLFIIDEINRGEVSKIFGETFSLLEPSYRGADHQKSTQYQKLVDKEVNANGKFVDRKGNEIEDGKEKVDDLYKEGFYIPENVYIVGCMNDIDRSVETIDFAMRRRFAWIEITAEDSKNMLYATNRMSADNRAIALNYMDKINSKIADSNSILGINYQLGASYFLMLEKYEGDIYKLWSNHISNVVKDYLVGVDTDNTIYTSIFNAYFRDELEMNRVEQEKLSSAVDQFQGKINKIVELTLPFKSIKEDKREGKSKWKKRTKEYDDIAKDIDKVFVDLKIHGSSTFHKQGNRLLIPRHIFSHDKHPVGAFGEYVIFQWDWSDANQLTNLSVSFAFGTGAGDTIMSRDEVEDRCKRIYDFFGQQENQKLIKESESAGVKKPEHNKKVDSLIYTYQWNNTNEENNKNALIKLFEIYERWYLYNLGNSQDKRSLLESNKNMILHGAPGTGKTSLATNELVEGLDKSHKKTIQFHPSYDYTDFVEGLRPSDNESFALISGEFKAFCEIAVENEQYYKDNIKDYISATNEYKNAKAAYKSYTDEIDDKIVKELDKYISDCNKNWDSTSLELEEEAKEEAKAIVDGLIDAEMKFKEQTNNINQYRYVFIIDEVNRGEISKIFGELFFSIDPGYRGEDGRIKTQYQGLYDYNGKDAFKSGKGGFYVPENVYIIATMNEIDRSVEPMDFAMRRRFAWVNVKASETQDTILANTVKDKDLIKKAKKKMNVLNNKILETKYNLGAEYQIGASYFSKIKDYDGNWELVWNFHLKPILEDYLNGRADDLQAFYKIYKNA